MLPALALALVVSAARAAEPSRTVEIVSISGFAPSFSTRIMTAFEAFLRARADGAVVADVRTAAVTQTGREYRFRGGPAAVSTGTVPALETSEGFLFLSPPRPELLDAFRRAVNADPDLPAAAERRAALQEGAVHFETPSRADGRERAALSSTYRLEIQGRPVDAVFILKTRGGLGRLATALAQLGEPRGGRLVVSRGDWAPGGFKSSLRGRALYEALEGLGLKAAAVGVRELRRWEAVKEYAKARPGGIKFLSANLEAPDSPAAPSAVFETGGLKVGVIGLTRPSHALTVGRARLAGVSLGDPVAAARREVLRLRPDVDVLVALSNLDPRDDARLRAEVRGLDAVLGSGEEGPRGDEDGRTLSAVDERRGPFSTVLPAAPEQDGLGRLTFAAGPRGPEGTRRVELRQEERPLDDSLSEREDLPAPSAAEFEGRDGAAPLIPSAHRLFPEGGRSGGRRGHPPVLEARDFWTLAAGLLADRTGSEVGFLPVQELGAPTPGDFHEAEVRGWLHDSDELTTFDMDGSALAELLSDARAPGSPLAAGGFGPRDTVHGAKIDRSLHYRVLGSERLLELLAERHSGLGSPRDPRPAGDLGEELIAALQDAAAKGWPDSRYAALMDGEPVRETPLWTVNFRDVSLDFSNTRVVKDASAFSGVSNSRIRGFDQRSLGGTVRADVDYRFRTHRWTNVLDLQYSETRVRPPGEPPVVDLTNNRIFFQTLGTESVGTFPLKWLGREWGPSAGAQYEGQVKRSYPGARRRNVYSLTPGVEIFDGDAIQSFQLSGLLQRDYSYEPPESHYGLYSRLAAQKTIRLPGGSRAKAVGQVWYNYYFRRHGDTGRDLSHEGDASLKLQIPIWRDMALAPFVDLYFFKLKERPLSGYSAMTGVSLSFSRLWKPQYERL